MNNPLMNGLTEVAGIEYCRVHGGIMVEGSSDECQYEETESDDECVGTALFFDAREPEGSPSPRNRQAKGGSRHAWSTVDLT